MAKPFYDRLHNLGFNTKLSLQNHGASGWAYDYPWNPATPTATNLAPANLGQLKWVFSFDLTGFSIIDVDVDHLPDPWEVAHGLSPTNPNDGAVSDIDEDGLPDYWEIKWGMDPTNGDENGNGMPDCFEDFDDDGISNEEEAVFHLNPYSRDTDGDSMPDDWELAHDFDPTDSGDAGDDPDEDGFSNAQEFADNTDPKSGMESPEPEEKVEFWFHTIHQSFYSGSWHTDWTEAWRKFNWQGPDHLVQADFYLASRIDDSQMMGEFYFKNVGPKGDANIKWVDFEATDFLLTKLTPHPLAIPLGAQTPNFVKPYSPQNHTQQGILKLEVKESAPESGFDNFERYTPPNATPIALECPWVMVPIEHRIG